MNRPITSNEIKWAIKKKKKRKYVLNIQGAVIPITDHEHMKTSATFPFSSNLDRAANNITLWSVSTIPT